MATPQVSVYALYPRLCGSAFPLVMFPAGPHALSSWLCLHGGKPRSHTFFAVQYLIDYSTSQLDGGKAGE